MSWSLEDSTQLATLANQVRYSTGVSGSLSVSDMENALLNCSNWATVSTITIQPGDTTFNPPPYDRYVLLCSAVLNGIQSNWIYLRGTGWDANGITQGLWNFYTIDSSGVTDIGYNNGPFHWADHNQNFVIDASSISDITAIVFHENGV